MMASERQRKANQHAAATTTLNQYEKKGSP